MRVSAENTEIMPTIELDASEHPIKAVTVFSSRKAEIVRTFTVELEEGENEIHITSIPSCIDTDSARITGLGDAILFDIVCNVAPAYSPKITSPTIKALERSRATLQGQKTLRGHAGDIFVRYGLSMNAKSNTGGAESVDSFLNAMLERGDAILNEAEELDAKIEELDWVIEEERRKLVDYMESVSGSVTAVIMAKKQDIVEITLTYMVVNASWSPTYELHATTEDGHPPTSISLHYRAAIQQKTGEDWRNTTISVSTATPGLNETIPALRALCISPAKNANTAEASKGPVLPNPESSGAAAPAANSSTGFSGTQSTGESHMPVQNQPTPPTLPVGLFDQQQQPPTPPIMGFFSQQRQPPTPPTLGFFSQQRQPPTPPTLGFFGQQRQAQTPPHFACLGSAPKDVAQQQQQPEARTPPVLYADISVPNLASHPQPRPQQQQANPVKVNPSEGFVDVNSSNVSLTGATVGSGEASDHRTVSNPDATDARKGWADWRAVVTESDVSSVFNIEGNCSIPSEPTPHKLAIAILKLDAKVNYVVVPRTTACAFLQCDVTNASEYRLLRGPVTVYLDNNLVSKASIPDVNPKEHFQCTFGPDPSIRIKCTRLPPTVGTAGSQYAAQTSVATYKLRTEIQNTHAFPITGLVVRDAAPTPVPFALSATAGAPSGIKVLLKRPEGLGEAEPGDVVNVDLDDEEKGKGSAKVKVRWPSDSARKVGKYEWVVGLGAGEQVKLDAEYDVRAPSDLKWVLTEEFSAE